MSQKSRLGILGATGSVGRSGLEAAAALGLTPHLLVANADAEGMLELCARYRPEQVAMASPRAAAQVRAAWSKSVLSGEAAIVAAVADCEVVLAAISGAAGLAPTMAALGAGARVLIANKEALILAGDHLLGAARAGGGELIPVDSEHNALAELLMLAESRRDRIARVWLTASGGPFLGRQDNLRGITPAQAIRHPVWKMGAKISVDSATMMNKGLEVIEACILFDLQPSEVEVVVHPQSVVHALVEFEDGGCLAQCAPADMRATIARGLTWPAVPRTAFGRIDWLSVGRLDFRPPDVERFPCLRLAYQALAAGGSAPAVLSAANEVAVASFLDEQLDFADIPGVVEETLAREAGGTASTLDDLIAADARARQAARSLAATRA